MSNERTPQRRSRNGCWTCKRRRRKCDETRPVCTTCQDGGHQCEGYEPRLRWGIGVASRGYLTGAIEPNTESAPPRPKGRQRDLLKQAKQQNSYLDTNQDLITDTELLSVAGRTSLSSDAVETPGLAASPDTLRAMQKETLFQEFLSSGSLLLHATSVDDSPLSPILSSLCEKSETLYDVCVACQAYLSYGADPTFYDLYSEALNKFRNTIDHPLRTTDEALINAALLLCTIGILQGTPWTIHIHGIERLLDERAALSPLDNVEPAFLSAIEVMGVMDLDIFCVGRQSPSLKAWRRYREGQFVRYEEEQDSVQAMAGLPRSLLDLLAFASDELTEEEMWLWPGCQGTYMQCQLWEAYRFAAMLYIRAKNQPHSTPGSTPVTSTSKIKLPSYNLLVTRALSAIDAVFNGQTQPGAQDSLVLNAMYFPLFQTSIEVLSSGDQDGRHSLVKRWFDHLILKDVFENTKQAWIIAEAFGAKRRQGVVCTTDEVAKSMGIELGLF